jgi:quercetin dioxygenase-like cupin family protein
MAALAKTTGRFAMQAQPFVVTPSDVSPISVLGVRITVLATNTATHAYEITLQEGEEGAGPPPHRHDWDESFYVLRGAVEIDCDGNTTTCGPGSLVHVPRGTLHGYRFGAGGGAMLEVAGQGGRATSMFRNVGKEFPRPPSDLPRLVGLLRENGVSLAA